MGKTISATHLAISPGGRDPLHFADAVNLRLQGLDAQRLGRYPEAAACFDRSRAAFLRIGDEIQAAWTLQNEGQILEFLGHPAEAIECFSQAATIFGLHGETAGADLMFRRRGDTLRRLGDQARARREYGQALAHYRARKDPNGIINTASSDAASLLLLGQDASALASLHEGLGLLRSFQRKAGEFDVLFFGRLADAERRAGRAAQAAHALDEARRLLDSANLRNDRSNPDLIAMIPALDAA